VLAARAAGDHIMPVNGPPRSREDAPMTELARKTCTPCRGGTPPLDRAAAEAYLQDAADWQLRDDGRRIERTYRFKNFKQALGFVDRVGALAEDEGHHPDISFGWGYATVSLHTHKIKGLHENDFIMAVKINDLAAADGAAA
jgi:4a-hydroxytetrahydrobiopterin dehydratase